MGLSEGAHVGFRRILDRKEAGNPIHRGAGKSVRIVGTDLLAEVASKQPSPSMGFSETSPVVSRPFDRQIAETSSGVEKMGSFKRIRRTGIETS